MSKDQKLLQLFYAGVLADTICQYEQEGVLVNVTQRKLNQQKLSAPGQLKQLEISNPEELFRKFSEIFGCINWEVEKNENGYSAIGKSCLLCAISKRMNTSSPCDLYCINPLRSMLEAMKPSYRLEVSETLWNGGRCEFCVKPEKQI